MEIMTSAEWEQKVLYEECAYCVHEHDNWGFNKHCEECYRERKKNENMYNSKEVK